MIEPLFAERTGVRSFARVGVNVILQIALLMKALTTDRAFVGFVILMRLHVGDESGGSVEGLVADFAFKRSIC